MTDNTLDLNPILAALQRRQARLNRLYVRTPEIDAFLELIHDFRGGGYRGPDNSACCLLVVGPTNSGKTRLFRRYCDRPDAQSEDEHIPVLRFTVPSPFRDRDFLAAILLGLGTRDFSESHRIGRMKRRVVEMLAVRKTGLIMMEETQHIIDKRGGNSPYWAADMIKEMILDGAKVPVVFNGIAVTEDIFRRNTQLLSRRKGVLRLGPDDWDDFEGRERFKASIAAFEMAADFPEKAEVGPERLPLNSDQVAERIHRATAGLRGSLCMLMAQAMELGTKREARSLSLDLLAEANAILSDAGPGWKNVFTTKVLPPLEQQDASRVTKLHKRGRAA